MSPQMTTAQKLTRARTQLLLNQPFFGTLGSEVEAGAGFAADDGDRRLADRL